MSNKKASKRKQNRLKVVELRNQSLKNNAPVFGRKITLQEINRSVLDSVLAKVTPVATAKPKSKAAPKAKAAPKPKAAPKAKVKA